MLVIRNILISLGLSTVITLSSFFLESDFVDDFLDDKLISLLVTLFAIHIAQVSLLVPRLIQVKRETSYNFSNTVKEIKISILEQIAIIALAFMVLLIKQADTISDFTANYPFIFSGIQLAIFIYAIYILWDTSNSILKIYEL